MNQVITMAKQMSHEERIEIMKKNLGTRFEEEARKILADGKILKGNEAFENFNKELNELTFEMEQLYPLTYPEFKEAFPRTIELVSKVNGNKIVDAVNKGLVLQGWSEESNVNEIIANIKENIIDEDKAKKEISLRKDVMNEIARMKEEYDIDWCQDLFWKCWKIKEGNKRFDDLHKMKGQTLANKRIETLKNIGGIEFFKVLQKEVYGESN